MPVKKESASQSVKEPKVKKVTAAKVAKPVVETEEPATKVSKSKTSSLSAPVYSLAGTESGSLDLPKEVFGVKVNKNLLAQAVRVYSNNQKGHWSHTKTRGEVTGSTRKIFKQKHTGRARHGSIKAPIFVGGGR